MVNMRRMKIVGIAMCMLIGLVVKGSSGSNSLTTQCGGAIQKLSSCLQYAAAKVDSPTKECCSAVSTMKDDTPVCLCFFIAQAHNGSDTIKSLGVQESRLLLLPSACHLHNATASNCPGLLGISPSSPAAAIFKSNASSITTPASLGGDVPSPVTSGYYCYNNTTLFGIFIAIFASLSILF